MTDEELQVSELPIDELMSLKRDAELYRKLRAMHWNYGMLCVVRPSDVLLGSQTYSGESLDETIRDAGK